MASSLYSLAVEEPSGVDLVFSVMFICLGLALVALQFVRHEAKLKFYLLTVSLFAPLYLYEAWVGRFGSDEAFDSRSKYEITMELRGKGVQAYPAAHPYNFRDEPLEIAGRAIVPLGVIPSATTVFCSEGGPYIIYESDRFGFRNPPGEWEQPVQVAFLGDSYTEGACVDDQYLAGAIRDRFPGTLNLGMSGTGPLVQLAQIREYLSIVKPLYVFWFYYEGNDLLKSRGKYPDKESDLVRESKQEILTSYLDPGFKQGLFEMRDAVRIASTDFVERKLARKLQKEREGAGARAVGTIVAGASNLLTLREIRAAISTFFPDEKKKLEKAREMEYKKEGLEKARELLSYYRKVLRVANDEVDAWGGQLVMVNLPDRRSGLGKRHPLKSDLLDLWSDLGIDVVDPTSTFLGDEDPDSLRYRHYSERGYGIVADALLGYLEAKTANPAQAHRQPE
jgi:hypothetical protein